MKLICKKCNIECYEYIISGRLNCVFGKCPTCNNIILSIINKDKLEINKINILRKVYNIIEIFKIYIKLKFFKNNTNINNIENSSKIIKHKSIILFKKINFLFFIIEQKIRGFIFRKDLIKTNLPLNSHYDADTLILYGCMNLLKDFVEKDSEIIDWNDSKEYKKIYREISEIYIWWLKYNKNSFNDSLSEYDKEDEMLTRLIKIRRHLWS